MSWNSFVALPAADADPSGPPPTIHVTGNDASASSGSHVVAYGDDLLALIDDGSEQTGGSSET